MSRVALVTGAAGGIGGAIATALAQRGYSVHGTDLAAPPSTTGFARFTPVDLRSRGALAALARSLAEEGPVHAVVHCAAQMHRQLLEETPLDAWDDVLAVNLRAAFELLRGAAPGLRSARGAALFLSSVHARATSPGAAPYAASKAALEALAASAALELAPEVRVNALAPGAVNTSMLDAPGQGRDALAQAIAARTPLGRVASPEEIARVACFLLEDDAGFITGQTVVVDGGALALLGTES